MVNFTSIKNAENPRDKPAKTRSFREVAQGGVDLESPMLHFATYISKRGGRRAVLNVAGRGDAVVLGAGKCDGDERGGARGDGVGGGRGGVSGGEL